MIIQETTLNTYNQEKFKEIRSWQNQQENLSRPQEVKTAANMLAVGVEE